MDKKLASKNIGQKIEEERAFMHEGCFRNPEACFCLLVLCLDFDRTPCAWQLIKKKKKCMDLPHWHDSRLASAQFESYLEWIYYLELFVASSCAT
jgi:hypothetical protein